jgi:FtsH-binding integral membrane protein
MYQRRLSATQGGMTISGGDPLLSKARVAREALTAGERRRIFARHFAEMLVAMLVGMGVLAGLASLTLAAAGSSLAGQPDAFRVMVMGVAMTVPMVLWMRHRGHATSRNVEMAATMLVPSVVTAALVAADVLGLGAGFAVQHAVMVPAMLGVMLWRYDHYSGSHAHSA